LVTDEGKMLVSQVGKHLKYRAWPG